MTSDAAIKLGHLGILARVVENKVLHRTETATNRRIQEAHFRELCRIEDYDFKAQPSLDRKVILDLAELGTFLIALFDRLTVHS